MNKQSSIDAMNRVMNALRYSVASYLRFARPWVDVRADAVADSVRQVADSHRKHAVRVGELLVERHGHVESRTFPTAFTGLNDLSIEYLLPLVIEDEKQIIRLIESTAEALTCDADARELAAEVVESEKRHLQMLQSALARSYSTASDSPVRTRPSTLVSPTSSERLHVGKPPVVRWVPELAPC